MIYLDNAATSHYKPKCVYDALLFDIQNSANSGRSGHKLALSRAMEIEKTRRYLADKFNGDNLIFTKNCTEALNLGILGFIRQGMTVVTTENEHNSVLRPLYALKERGVINLIVLPLKDGYTPFESLKSAVNIADLVVISLVDNVLGVVVNLDVVGKMIEGTKARLLVDGAQGVPYVDVDMKQQNISMLALPAHKGLHGIQGAGALVINDDVKLSPIIYGGTGTESFNPTQPTTMPEGYESGTLFSGGICAFGAGAKWTYDNIGKIRHNVDNLAKECLRNLIDLGVTVYSKDTLSGIVTFNVDDLDSQYVANLLDEKNIAVRGGIHCAPLVHRHLGTEKQGAVRVSFGADSTEKDMIRLLNAIESIKSGKLNI